MASADLRDELNCSICLSVYTDPVMLSCGHNFCRVCIDRVLDTQRESSVYSCPDCRELFRQRPTLHRNLTLRNIAERFLAEADQQDSGVFCSYCIRASVPAVKSCLLCEASLCADHLRVHSKSEEHVLSEPTIAPGERKCPVHKKVLMYYCAMDGACVCLSCCLNGEHRGHQVDLMNEASEKKRKRLYSIVETLTTRRENADRKLESLYEQRKLMPTKTAALQRQVNYVFNNLKRQLEDLRKKISGEISRQESQVSLSVGDLIQQLEMKKEELTRNIHQIEELYNAPDPVTLLQEACGNSFSALEIENDDDDDDGDKDSTQDNLDEDLIVVMLHKGLSDIMTSARKGFTANWASDTHLDERTASNNVHISGDQKTASWSQKSISRPETPERFQSYKVLSSTKFSSGRHYWEVEASKLGNWRMGMAYASIERKGDQSNIGNNDKSWGLRWWSNQLSVRYGCKEINLTPKLMSSKIGMYLDYEGGRLSFYELCSPIRHLHTYKVSFTEPLHVIFALWNNAWLKI